MNMQTDSSINIYVFLFGLLEGNHVTATTCYYLDKNSYGIHQKVCEGTCCVDNGRDGEICCDVTWSAGEIAAVCLGSLFVIVAAAAIGVRVWLTVKKKREPSVVPQVNGNTNVELQLNNNPVCSSRISVRNISPSMSQNCSDLPPPYTPGSSRPASGHSGSSQVSFLNESDRSPNPALKPPPYTKQTMRSPGRSLAPHSYTFQPSPVRSLAPSRAW